MNVDVIDKAILEIGSVWTFEYGYLCKSGDNYFSIADASLVWGIQSIEKICSKSEFEKRSEELAISKNVDAIELFAIIHNTRAPATTQKIVNAIISAGFSKNKKE